MVQGKHVTDTSRISEETEYRKVNTDRDSKPLNQCIRRRPLNPTLVLGGIEKAPVMQPAAPCEQPGTQAD